MIRRPPRSTLFPSPPLFRSVRERATSDPKPDRRGGPSGPPAYALRPSSYAISFAPSLSTHRQSARLVQDRKSTRLNSSHLVISYAVFCLKKKRTLPARGPLC